MKNKDRENFNSIFGLFFFGVPNQGINVDHWLPMVKGQPNEILVRSLGLDSTILRRLHEEFQAAFDLPDSQIVAIYETERTRLTKVRIDKFSASLDTYSISRKKRMEGGLGVEITLYLFQLLRLLTALLATKDIMC